MDTISQERRSENMRRIRNRDTKPEMLVRSLLHRSGYRFRLHYKDLPGKPDIVFTSRRKVIFVHGCFWHQHGACSEGRIPNTRRAYWNPKLNRNKERDTLNLQRLQALGWDTLEIWECETKKPGLQARLARFLN
ncbi:MAG TPA: DNA mismatch endonuclease Vsr [Candidatus Angelobacter sp.]|nr:DNA mismatch endonuclease Vsr [Candidatus Angelobacter sp.]